MLSCQEKLWLGSNWCQYILWIVLDNKSKKMSNILIEKRDKKKAINKIFQSLYFRLCYMLIKVICTRRHKRGSKTPKRSIGPFLTLKKQNIICRDIAEFCFILVDWLLSSWFSNIMKIITNQFCRKEDCITIARLINKLLCC